MRDRKDGKTSYERNKGKPGKVPPIALGERVLWKKRVGPLLAKVECRCDDGVFLGCKPGTAENIVAASQGVWKSRSVKKEITR